VWLRRTPRLMFTMLVHRALPATRVPRRSKIVVKPPAEGGYHHEGGSN
jgi:hypothetical protein